MTETMRASRVLALGWRHDLVSATPPVLPWMSEPGNFWGAPVGGSTNVQ